MTNPQDQVKVKIDEAARAAMKPPAKPAPKPEEKAKPQQEKPKHA